MMPLTATAAGLERHAQLLLGDLTRILPNSGRPYRWDLTTFRGRVLDLASVTWPGMFVERSRGGRTPAVPLNEIGTDATQYWLSLHQEWIEVGSSRFGYRTTSISVYAGPVGLLKKPMLFRAEWPGLIKGPDGEYHLEAEWAGHPHWQFDALQGASLVNARERERLLELSKALEEVHEVEEFTSDVITEVLNGPDTTIETVIQRLDRIHFAMAVTWATRPWSGDLSDCAAHATVPSKHSEVKNWVVSTCRYVLRELSRL